MNANNLLLKARDIIEDKGWVQERWQDEEGRVCVTEAIWQAHRTGYSAAAFMNAKDKLRETIGQFGLMEWNDSPGMTEEEVLNALEVAAK